MQDTTPTEEKTKVEVKVEPPGPLNVNVLPPAPGNESAGKFNEIWEQVSSFLSDLPDYVGDFFSEYQRPLLTVGLILGGFITVKVTLAVLDAVNDIPLLAPLFELVGIGYTGWFVYRYLLRASSRAELSDELKALKGQVVGNNSSNL